MPGPLPLFWVSLAFLAGIGLGSATGGSPWAWTAAAGGLALCELALSRAQGKIGGRFPGWLAPLVQTNTRLGLAPLLLAVLACAGAARYQFTHQPLTSADLAWYNDAGAAVVKGIIAAEPEQRDTYTLLRVRVSQRAGLDADGLPGAFNSVRGLLLARVSLGTDWHYGDEVRLQGKVVTPPDEEGFSYRDYLAVQEGIYAYLPYGKAVLIRAGQGNPVSAWIIALRERALTLVRADYPAPESALLAGILLGDDHDLPNELQNAFQTTGTAHIIAISGFNIGILAGLFTRQFNHLFGRVKGSLAAVLAIVFYVALVGGGASVIRAAIMGAVGIFGGLFGRRQEGFNTLAATSAAMCLYRPDWLWDTSFQLSFMATLGLILYAQPLEDAFLRAARRCLPEQAALRLAGPVGEYCLFTLAAQVTTLPIVATTFGQFSWTAFLVNPLVLPPQPAVIELGGLALILGFIYPPLGQAAAWLTWPFVAYTIRVVEWFGALPNPAWETGPISQVFVIVYYAGLIGFFFFRTRLAALRQTLRPAVILAGVGAAVLLVWQAAFNAPDGRLRLTLLDTPGSETLLVQTPGGQRLLINGGESAAELQTELDRRRSLFSVPHLDLLVVAQTTSAAANALTDTVGRYAPDWVLWSGDSEKTSASSRLWETLAENDVSVTRAAAGQSIDLGGSGKLKVIGLESEGIDLLLEYNGFRAWLSFGGLTVKAGEGPVTALLTGGSVDGSALEALRPRVILSTGDAGDVPGYTWLSTSRCGWIEITTDGEQFWVETER